MKIDERTTVSIGLLGALLGGAMWLTKISFQNDAYGYAIGELKTDRDSDRALLKEIRDTVIRMEERMRRHGRPKE